jgi:hypothetical protein
MAHDQLADQQRRIGPVRWRHGLWSPEMAFGSYDVTLSWILLLMGVGRNDELTSGIFG